MNAAAKAAQRGFTLVELMIALVIGLTIMAALSQVFVAGQSSYSLQDRFGVLQENGRYALYFLQRDIRNAGLPKVESAIVAFDVANTLDGGGNVSDQIGVQYRATVAGTTDCLGNNIALGAIVRTVYSVNTDPASGISRLRCAAQGQPAQPIVDGIENMQILYGVDLDVNPANPGFGYANLYVPASAVAADQWQKQVVAVRVAVLASTINPVTGDTDADNTRPFTLLDAPPFGPLRKNFPFPNGPQRAIRGRVFTTTIEVRNRTAG